MDSAEPVSDAELISDYVRSGSEDAFKALVQRHSAMVFATCRRGLGGDATTLAKAQSALNTFRGFWFILACDVV